MRAVARVEEHAAVAPEEVLRWAYETFPRVVIVASFQAESTVLIEMASRIRPGVNVLTLNLALTFQAAFAGVKNVYGYAQSAAGLTSGWPKLGTWSR